MQRVDPLDPRGGDRTHTTHCVIIFVAVDGDGQPVAVPAWTPATDEDRALERYATRLMELRKGIEAEMRPYQA